MNTEKFVFYFFEGVQFFSQIKLLFNLCIPCRGSMVQRVKNTVNKKDNKSKIIFSNELFEKHGSIENRQA